MVAFPGGSKEVADALYEKAISLGATCDGAPGQRVETCFTALMSKTLTGINSASLILAKIKFL